MMGLVMVLAVVMGLVMGLVVVMGLVMGLVVVMVMDDDIYYAYISICHRIFYPLLYIYPLADPDVASMVAMVAMVAMVLVLDLL